MTGKVPEQARRLLESVPTKAQAIAVRAYYIDLLQERGLQSKGAIGIEVAARDHNGIPLAWGVYAGPREEE